MTTATTPKLTHGPACTQPRPLDETTHAEYDVTTLHCVDCGAHQAFTATGEPIAPPTDSGPFYSADPKPYLLDGITIERAEGKR